MKTIFKNYKLPVITALGIVTLAACTKLEPELKDPNSIAPTTAGGAPATPSISAVYEQLNGLTGGQGNWFGMQEHTTDEVMGPTRGTDWDDFGTWRRLHLHTWGPDHNQLRDTWNQLNGALFQTTLVAESSTATPQVRAEGQFLRSYFRYLVCDLYGQVQSRPATAPAAAIPTVLSRAAAIDTIIAELEGSVANLPNYTRTNRTMATKEAAWALLMKCYLNKAVFKQSPSNPAGPYSHQQADMNRVIQYANSIAANTLLSIDTYYWDNFKWDNGTQSSENIFTRHNGSDPNGRSGNGAGLRWQTSQSWHYNQRPDGWNGFVALSTLYDAFDATDVRRADTLAGFTDRVGSVAGMIVGQARGPLNGSIGGAIGNLRDRSGNPLIFTRNASIFFNGEASGIRFNKFPLDPSTINDGAWGSNNEFPLFRFSDVRLMKAEAILRGGTDAETPLAIVNGLRARRRVGALTSVNLNTLLAERGRELYMEGWRRNDMVRFEVFNAAVEERPNASDKTRVVFSIPTEALASNPNLKQNVGY
jgi:starch-binding outer membrane protein, SusD/RagB family